MLCDKYKEKLIEAAVRGAALPPSLRDDVNVCAHCCQTFAAQRTILSAIDIGLKEIANAEVPRSFQTRVTANLPVEKMPVYSRIPTWGLVPAAGILIVALTLSVVPHYREKQIAAESMGVGKVAPDVLGERGNRPILGRNTAHHSNVSKLHIQRNVSTDFTLKVLVPPEEEQVLRRYYTTLRDRPNATEIVLAGNRDRQPTPLVIEQIEFHELRIESLEDQTNLIEMNAK
jgi:hypothetical protein